MPIRTASIEDSSSSETLLREAESLLAGGDRQGAAASLEKAHRFDPTNDELPLMAAMLHFQDGRLERAASLALASLRSRPFNPSAMNLLGVVCLDAGQADLAQTLLRRATRMAPGLEGARENLRQARRAAKQRQGGKPSIDLPLEEIRELTRRREPRLSACVLARTSADLLSECLDSLEGVAGEILIVDATDQGAVEAAVAGRGAKVLRVEWNDDYSAARNEAIRRATGDWILVLDAEERLLEEEREKLEKLMRSRSALDYAVEIRYDPEEIACLEIRLFRNAPGVRFRGRVFEEIRPSLKETRARFGLESLRSELRIERSVGGPTRGFWRRHRETLARVLQRNAEEDPENPYVMLDVARLALENGEAARALEIVRQVRRGWPESGSEPDEGEQEEIATLEGCCLMRIERYDELAGLLREHHAAYEPTRNTLFLEGVVRRATGDPTGAIESLHRCLDEKRPASFVPPLDEVRGAGAANMLGAAMIDLGRLDEAGEAFRDALSREPENLEAELGLVGLRLADGEIQEVLASLDRLVRERGDQPGVWAFGSIVLNRVPDLAPTARAWMEEACSRFPGNPGFRRGLGEAHLRCGEAREALEAWDGLPPGETSDLAGTFAARLVAGGDLPDVAEDRRAEIGDGVLEWFRTWIACSAYEALDRALLEIERAQPVLPDLTGMTAGWLEKIGQPEAAARLRERVAATD
jgi:tetratricopeptide (TPR) repeat protein